MKKGPIEDERIYLTLGVVLREYGAVRTDLCLIPDEVAAITGLPLELVGEHVRELRARRVLVLKHPANTRPSDTYWLNLYQLTRFTKHAPENMRFVYPPEYFRRRAHLKATHS